MLSGMEMMTISERMGEAVHNAWMDKRKKEKGWHSPDECPSYNKKKGIPPSEGRYCLNCHPCMKPYSELPDTEKELDREYPKLFFEILNDMGFKVVKKKQSQIHASEGQSIADPLGRGR